MSLIGQTDSNVTPSGTGVSPSNITLVHTLDRLVLDDDNASDKGILFLYENRDFLTNIVFSSINFIKAGRILSYYPSSSKYYI